MLGALVVTGAALEGRTRRGVAGRIAESLQADAAIERGDLALVRGRLDLAGLAVLAGIEAIAVMSQIARSEHAGPLRGAARQ